MDNHPHPAKYSLPVLDALAGIIPLGSLVLDPFAGVGRIHLLPAMRTWGVEIEPEWASAHPRTVVGNALRLPFDDGTFDCVATSPVYGNRASDHHNARDGSKRITYRHTLGRALHDANAGQLQWGPSYRSFHRAAWREAVRVLKPEGMFVLNISDHIRQGRRMPVTAWHFTVFGALGLECVDYREISTRRMKFGANRDERSDCEVVSVFRRSCDE